MRIRALSTQLAALAAGAALLAGCGSGGSKTSSASSLQKQCESTRIAAAEYTQAGSEFDFRLQKPELVAKVFASSQNLKAALAQLAKDVQGESREQLQRFAAALGRQEQLLHDLTTHNTAGEAALAKSIQGEIPRGLSSLERICAKTG